MFQNSKNLKMHFQILVNKKKKQPRAADNLKNDSKTITSQTLRRCQSFVIDCIILSNYLLPSL